MKHKLQPEKMASKLGKHPFFVKKQYEALVKNPLKHKFHLIIQHMAKIDQKIKTGKLSAKQALISLLNTLKYQI